MPKQPKPIIHNRDHEHGGADPVRIVWEDVGDGGGTGGGIQFDLTPQAGGFLQVTTSDYMNIETEGSSPLNLDANGSGSVNVYAAEGDINVSAGDGVIIHGHGDNGVVVEASGDGDIQLSVTGGTGSVRIFVHASTGQQLIINGLPTTDPGVSGAVWNDGGTLKIH